MERASYPAVAITVLALAAGGPGCLPSPACGDGQTCHDDERCEEGACVPAGGARVTITGFTGAPEQIAAGGSSRLSWTTRNAAACSLSPSFGSVPRSGSVEVRPSVTTSWSLSCEGSGGPATAEVTVRVEAHDGGAVDAALPDDGGDLDASRLDAAGSDGGARDAGGGDDDGGAPDGGLADGAGDGGSAEPPVVVSGSIELLGAPPTTVEGSASALGAVIFRERQGVLLEEWVHADQAYPASYGAGLELDGTGPRVQLVTGHVLDSWLLHVENASTTVPLTGTLVFASEVVAVSWRHSTLEEYDDTFGAPGAIYPGARGFSLGDDDAFTLEADRRTLHFSTLGTDADELRILVDSDGEPRPMVQTWTLNLERSGPLDLQLDAYQPDSHGALLDEGAHTLTLPLSVDVSTPGKYEDGVTLTSGELAAGTDVHSWLIHFDTPPSDGGVATFVAVVSFAQPVLGIITTTGRLQTSDATLGRADVTYPVEYAFRGVEPNFGDSVWWSLDRRSVRLSFQPTGAGVGLDELRVVTAP